MDAVRRLTPLEKSARGALLIVYGAAPPVQFIVTSVAFGLETVKFIWAVSGVAASRRRQHIEKDWAIFISILVMVSFLAMIYLFTEGWILLAWDL
jgi:hypothetical protein